MKAYRVIFSMFSRRPDDSVSESGLAVSQKSEDPHNPQLQILGPVVASGFDGLDGLGSTFY